MINSHLKSIIIISSLIVFAVFFSMIIYMVPNLSEIDAPQNNYVTINYSPKNNNTSTNEVANASLNTDSNHCSPTLSKNAIISNPSFSAVAQAGCENNPYIGKQVRWQAAVSSYAHTGGIRFWVIDQDHSYSDAERSKHGFFWGTFLGATKEDPRETENGLKNWDEKWNGSWVNYIMDTYGNINYNTTKAEKFFVTAVIDSVDCNTLYDGCYIETTVKKIE